ncbi:hypothetical protein AKJ08_1159 [Vulgatibacter incomptus]|uniref:Uncharacterized protein n=1 Tax=Vulgatibacter incomptus TaxID=1391653 RepID=A0A0K1PBA5_9BACT|nr:hypothetical protein AKJ08_1159 [Vulgatibacter incomptus]
MHVTYSDSPEQDDAVLHLEEAASAKAQKNAAAKWKKLKRLANVAPDEIH